MSLINSENQDLKNELLITNCDFTQFNTPMTLYIKYMLSLRCKMLVKEELKKLGIPFITVDLGEVRLLDEITETQREELKAALLPSGLYLMDDHNATLIEKIKIAINEMIDNIDDLPKENFSEYLSEKLDADYTSLANLFSETEGKTIEHFIIQNKIERAKVFLIYDEHNLTEIAYKLQYSSVAALSNQFKKITGLTPTFFKSLKHKKTQRSVEL